MEPESTWRLAPAYDLTFSAGPGGEHTTMIGAESKAPTKVHLVSLAKSSGIKQVDADQIVSEIREACSGFLCVC